MLLHKVQIELSETLRITDHRPYIDADRNSSSNPASSRYAQHYTVDEIHELFAPKQNTIDTVGAWLQESGIAADRISQSVNKQWLQFDATASEVEALIKTEYYNYAHSGTGKTNIGCDE